MLLCTVDVPWNAGINLHHKDTVYSYTQFHPYTGSNKVAVILTLFFYIEHDASAL